MEVKGANISIFKKIEIQTPIIFFFINIFIGLALATNWKITIVILSSFLIIGFVYLWPQMSYLFLVFVLFSDLRGAEHISIPFYVLDFSGPSIYIYDILVLFLVIGLLLRILAGKDSFPTTPVGLLVLLFCFLGLAGIGNAYYNGFPLFGYEWNIKQGRFILYALMFFVTFLTIKEKKDLQKLFSTINIAAVALFIFGFINLIRYWGISSKQLVIGRDPSNLLTFVFLVSLAFFLFGADENQFVKFPQRFPLIIVFAGGVLVISSLGRASILGLISGLFFLTIIALLGRKPEVLSSFFILFLIGFVFFNTMNIVIPGFDSEMLEETGNISRLNQWTSSLRIAEEHPIFGLGVGSVYKFFEPASKQDYIMPGGQVHNSFIWLLQKNGFLNLFTFLLIICIFFKHAITNFLSIKDLYLKSLTLGITSYIFAWIISASFQDNLIYSRLSIFFWISIALIFIIGSLCEKEHIFWWPRGAD